MTNKDELFQIAPSDNVGTQIFDPTMPSNIDFQQPKQSIQLTQIKTDPQPIPAQPLPNINPDNLFIKSYTLKGNVIFNLPPQYPLNSILPLTLNTFPVHALSDQDYSSGLWSIWQSLIGYVNREIIIDQGYIYLLSREKVGLRCVGLWRLVDVFKVFVDLEQLQLRLIVRIEGSDGLVSRDYQSPQLKNILARLNEQTHAIGLTLVG